MDREKIPDIDVDKILDKLLDPKGAKSGKNVNLTEQEIRGLCLKTREILMQ